MKKKAITGILVLTTIFLVRCINSATTGADKDKNKTGAIVPDVFPVVGIPGFKFPENSDTIQYWISKDDSNAIIAHGWGLWAGLTSLSADDSMYQTWNTPAELLDSINTMTGNNTVKSNLVQTIATVKSHRSLQVPPQFRHGAIFKNNTVLKSGLISKGFCGLDSNASGVYTDLITVSYDPSSADFIIKNRLYDTSSLTGYLAQGKTDIPPFPNTAIVLKPTYEIVHQKTISEYGGYFPFRVWGGPDNCEKGYPHFLWKGLVYIDTGNKSQDNCMPDNSGTQRDSKNTCNLNTFIYYTVAKEDTAAINTNFRQNGLTDVSIPGDLAILVGMHVTSKEIANWTWQTFWWTPDAMYAPLPSWPIVAQKRPSQIKGAPAHYAMAIGYAFITPQSNTGGRDTGTSIYCYNPFTEAVFGTATFNDVPGLVYRKGGQPQINRVGCQANCMSCHAIASYNPNFPIGQSQPAPYITDRYVDLKNDTLFNNSIKLDFLWSIQSNLQLK